MRRADEAHCEVGDDDANPRGLGQTPKRPAVTSRTDEVRMARLNRLLVVPGLIGVNRMKGTSR